MCLVTEHTRLRRDFDDLFKAYNKLNSQVLSLQPPKLPQGYPVHQLPWAELITSLLALGLEPMIKYDYPPDKYITYTDEASWEKIVPFLTYPAELYVAEAADCDDYSKWATADSSKLFNLNGCLQCWGDMPLGYHAWNLVITASDAVSTTSYKLFDANAGFPHAGKLFNPMDNGYKPEAWK